MATLNFGLMTAPIAEPYNDKEPTRQQENFYFRINQLLDQLKAQGATLDIDLTQAVLDLSFAGETLDLPGLEIKRSGKVVTIEYIP